MKDTLRQRVANQFSSWFPVLLLAALAALTYWLDSQVQRDGRGGAGAGQDPDYFVEDFSATRFGPGGDVVQRLAAKKLTHYPETRPTELVQPMLVDTPSGRPPMEVRADKGEVSPDNNDIYLSGHVVATREADAHQSRLTLSTEYLHVLPREEKAVTDRKVTITDAVGTHVGGAMEMDNKARTLHLKNGVTGEFRNTQK